MFVYVPAPPTPEAKNLGASIVALIRQSRQENPSIGPRDVQQAMQVALASMREELQIANSRVAMLTILVVLMALAGALIVLLK